VVLATSSKVFSQFFGDVLQAILTALLAGTAWKAGQTGRGFARTFWRFQAWAFAILAANECLATFYDAYRHKPLNEVWPSDLGYFIWVTPAVVSLLLDPEDKSQGIEWTQWLDFAQVGILLVSLYVFAFLVPGHWNDSTVAYRQLFLDSRYGRDALLVAGFALRAYRIKESEVRWLYGCMAIFFGIFSIAESAYLYLQVNTNLESGTVMDLPWTVALAAGVLVISMRWSAAGDPGRVNREVRKQPRTYVQFAVKLVPLCFPMVVLLMAAHIAEQQFAIAVGAVVLSFACSIARILLTEQRQQRAARELESRNALLKSVFEGTGDAIFVKDAAGRYVMANQAVASYFGKPAEEIIGKTAFELMDLEAARELTKNDKQILETGERVTVDLQLSVDGATHYFLVTRAPYRDPGGKIVGIIGISRDITQYKGIEERLRQSQKMEAIGTLAGGVAHDFNNILMVISGYSSVLAEALHSNAKLSGHVEQIRKAGERAASLTRQLLAFSRKETIQPAPLNLNQVVTNMEKLLERLIGEHIVIKTDLPSDLGMALADAGQMEQAVLNLAVNARDAMPNGGELTIETRNAVLLRGIAQGQVEIEPGEYVELTVSDTGTGMDAGVQAHIFEPFFTTKPVGKGTGLGLSTVYGIVQQSGGYITFESELERGSSFHIFLPTISTEPKPHSAEEDKPARVRGGETVLLVEDDASVCELVRAVLTSQGYSVLAARRPQEAEAICRTHGQRIDLLLTDVIMPEMSGPELAKRLGQWIAPARLLYMSGYIDDSVVRQEIQERGIPYLQKPFSTASLVKKVREVLDGVEVA